jgi:PAS domain S-box-containing protein
MNRSQPPKSSGWRSWIPYFVLVATLVLAFTSARSLALFRQGEERAKFQQAVDQTRGRLQREIDAYLVLLDGLRGLGNAQFAMREEQFEAYVEALRLPKAYPGAQSLGFAAIIPPDLKEAGEERFRKLPKHPFGIWPKSTDRVVCPINYLAPLSAENVEQLGFDLYSDAVRRSMLEKAVQTGEAAASPRLLPAHSEGTPAAGVKEAIILLASPLFWEGKAPEKVEERGQKIFGYFFCTFKVDDLFRVLTDTKVADEIAFRVYEGGPGDLLLHDSSTAEPVPAGDPNFTATNLLTLADRNWTVVFARQRQMVHGSGWYFHAPVAIGGVILAFGLFGLSLAQTRARGAADHHAGLQRAAEGRYRRLVEQSIVGIYVIQDARFVYVNPRMAEIFATTEADLSARPLLDFIAEESRAQVSANIDKRFRGEVDNVHYTLRGRRKDGQKIDLDAQGGLAEYDGRPAILGCLTDITEQRVAEKRIQAQLAGLNLLSDITKAIGERQDLPSIFQVVIRNLEDHLPVDFGCICLYDATDEKLVVASVGAKSQTLEPSLGLVPDVAIPLEKNGLWTCVHGELIYEPDLADAKLLFTRRLADSGLRALVLAPLLVESTVFGVLIAARRAPESFTSPDCEFLRQLSEHVALATHQAQVYQALQQAYDELRRTQQAVMHQERLRTIGQMASGIAHDINNAIMPVSIYTELILGAETNLSPTTTEYLGLIQESTAEVVSTIERLREMYRPREAEAMHANVDLNHQAHRVVELTRARWYTMAVQAGVQIEVRQELAADLPAIHGRDSEIREGLTNLVLNAVDAMPQGGTITLRTGVVEREPAEPGIPAAKSIFVEVQDTGVGMDEEAQRRCLEPFFTTKGERGSGLGLAMVFGILERHSGEIEIRSAPDEGTTFRLLFPLPGAARSAGRPATSDEALLQAAAHHRILIVDDDPLLINSLRLVLEGDGHQVTAADGGQAGIEAFLAAKLRGEPFGIVISDLGMPRVDGRKVAAAVKAAAPETAFILLTGWGHRLNAEGQLPPHVDRVLSKPPKLHDLREALRRCAWAK